MYSSTAAVFASPSLTAALTIIQTSLVLENTAETAVSSSKILLKILQNLVMPPTDDGRHRRLRLTNKTIARNIVNVKGAMELLSLVGFEKDGQEHIYLKNKAAPADASKDEMSLLALGKSQTDLIQGCCLELDQVVAELEQGMTQRNQRKAEAVVAEAPTDRKNTSGYSSSTLKEAEYKARIEKIAREKADKKKQKEHALRIWNENAKERKEIEMRKEAVRRKQLHTVQDEADSEASPFVVIRKAKKKDENEPLGRLPKPFAPTKHEEYGNQQLLSSAAAVRAKQVAGLLQQNACKPAAVERKSRPKSRLVTDNVDEDTRKPSSAMPLKENVIANVLEDIGDGATTSLKSPPSYSGKSIVDDAKMPARSDAAASNNGHSPTSDEEWQRFLNSTPRCAPQEGIRATSSFNTEGTNSEVSSSTTLSSKCLKRLLAELNALENDLPSYPRASIWIRFDEDSPQYLRVLMSAPLPGPSPYSGGVFTFDVFIPPTYPQDPPLVSLLTTGGGTVRFGPNLYACGKVCLSLLGTWDGPKWSPKHSTLLQVLVSIQGLILGVEHPYFLEPGHGGWEGSVKEGKFRFTGHTLSGKTVTQELGLPPEVVRYDDYVRVGTVKYAMLQAIQTSLDPSNSSNKWLCPFSNIIQAHFYFNQSEILSQVRSWTCDGLCGRNRIEMTQNGETSLQIDTLETTLIPKLERLLGQTKISVDFEKPTSVCRPTIVASGGVKDETQMAPVKRCIVSSAASLSDTEGKFVANKKPKLLQKELDGQQDPEELIKQAIEAGDVIRAADIQKQLIALNIKAQDADEGSGETDSLAVLGGNVHMETTDNSAVESQQNTLTSPAIVQGLGKTVFAPPGWMDKKGIVSHAHHWGCGYHLGAATASPVARALFPNSSAGYEETSKKQAIARDRICRLRIRLPNDKSIVKDFDMDDTLSDVYATLTPLVEPGMPVCSRGERSIAGSSPIVRGTFSQPLSSAGFTLLLPRPKREFSLEIHGTKTLENLNLVPSATLTVMKCQDRGVVYRGELESRLREAQGDAIDVDGLTYEGLVELTERVGTASPTNGASFVSLTVEELESNSEKVSAADYLASLDELVGEDARACPICLGNYDASDSTVSVRTLTKCHHHFHTACLETWLTNKSSCPLCKTSVCDRV
ncbi:ubiquitin-conjugating enzyme [Nitzschia inconspicua]|uniref:Ubiquitin-conjugating enzyme n=1 Tax=Nitzschia inconspicua TaxID=303405 RepID=A0A9K3M6K2_9STRA|nr:ubiquitin-conjugating enzyme [Nitzschia inconspicua]